MSRYSVIEYFGQQTDSHCGYCKDTKADKHSHSFWADSLMPTDYQNLIDRGWRRSGKYCYKPTMHSTCCPQYTIRCEALNFVPRKSHKKVLKRFAHFLRTGEKRRSCGELSSAALAHQGVVSEQILIRDKAATFREAISQVNDTQPAQSVDSAQSVAPLVNSSASVTCLQCDASNAETDSLGKRRSSINSAVGADPNKPTPIKARQIRLQRRAARLKAKGLDPNAVPPKPRKNRPKSLEEFLCIPKHTDTQACVHSFEIRLVPITASPTASFRLSFAESHAVYVHYQTVVHNDAPSKTSESQFKRFLCAALLAQNGPAPGHPGYGSFHQQYVLDGKIIAVGVIDVLPYCVSSKYFYYNPDYAFLSLGIYSALNEIAFVRRLNGLDATLRYYYMGFYIHSCPKMRYKGQYVPSFLLCPETYTWHSIERCIPLLDAQKYCRFAGNEIEDEGQLALELDDMQILHRGTAMPFSVYRTLAAISNSALNEITEYASLVGKRCAYSMLLYRQ